MRRINFDNLPHLSNCLTRMICKNYSTILSYLLARWWGINLSYKCIFVGLPHFRRHPCSNITINSGCRFSSLHTSNLIGINRPCMISTLAEGAEIEIGANCGFSGTVIGCAKKITFGENVRCGANTLITDSDWHAGDPRIGPDAPVTIKNNVWLGVNVTVLKGVTIGENTLVGAGSVVTRSLPPNVIAAGIPAKPLKNNNC